ncbi:MAG TPA: acyltransferase, partial [Pedobacter sp.]
VVFFALSGYVIAHTTTGNNRGPSQYAQSRLSRLYSVVLPTLLVTAIIEISVRFLDPGLMSHYIRGISWPRYILSGLYLNEIWFFSASPPINGPLWSLSFEFWYYVIFGLFFYRAKSWLYLVALLIACLIAGPKILAMMPIWILGNLAYRVYNPIKRGSLAWIIVFGSLFIAILLAIFLPSYPFKLGSAPLFFAGQFITDFIIGVFIALALWALPGFKNSTLKTENNRAMSFFRKFADLTFPLYVLHDPLLVLFRSIWKTKLHDDLQMWTAMVVVFIVSMALGSLMEENRYKWGRIFKEMFSMGEKMIVRYTPRP